MNNIENTDPKQDPNINYNILHNKIQHFKEMHMPVKLEHYNKNKHKKSSCITHGIIHSIQFRDKLHKIHKMTNPTSVDHEAQRINLKIYNNTLNQCKCMTKKQQLWANI